MSKILNGRKVVLGITGSIAAYKAAEIVRLLKKAGCEVQVVMSDSAREFIQPLTFQSLSGRRIYDKMFDQQMEMNIGHISIAHWADLILIAPASANIIGKIANGIADDLLSTVCMAFKGKIAIAPAMNDGMWSNASVRRNVEILKSAGCHFFGPADGPLACGDSGKGRMIDPLDIVSLVEGLLTEKILAGTRIMVTAGPTRENIDPVRFISNFSSGRMGFAIADAAFRMGADVTLVSGPVGIPHPAGIKVIKVSSADEMNKAVLGNIAGIDIFIAAAAVADYRPEQTLTRKMKKDAEKLTLTLVRNPDILKNVAFLPEPPFTVGFSAETENLIENARKKLSAKKIDMIAANLVGENRGFHSQENELALICRDGDIVQLGLKHKSELAEELLIHIIRQMNNE